jgi:hypothetical protein
LSSASFVRFTNLFIKFLDFDFPCIADEQITFGKIWFFRSSGKITVLIE